METLLLPTEKRKVRCFVSPLFAELQFGDYLLFQEYSQRPHDGQQCHYAVGRPMLVIYLGWLPCDQTVEIQYVKWQNSARAALAYAETDSLAEWNDFADVLGHWRYKPSWREILAAYRTQNTAEWVAEKQIDSSCEDPAASL